MPTLTPQLNKELELVRQETAPVIARAASLTVESAQDYAVADSFLTKLVDARKRIKTRLAKIIDPIKEALKEAQSLLKEADTPLEQSELLVRQRMRDFKLEEAQQARLEEQKRLDAAADLQRQADAKALAESKATTQQMKDKLAAQRADLEAQATVTAAAPAPTLAKAVGSTTRTIKVPVVKDMKVVLAAIVAGKIPLEVAEINFGVIRAHYRSLPSWVAKWPGIEMQDDIQIVKK